MLCSECNKEIKLFDKYAKHDKTGKILCKECFDEKIEKGEIK